MRFTVRISPICDADLESLGSVATEFDGLVRRITGKSGQLNWLFDEGANEFSELFAEEVRTMAVTNESEWRKALTSCVFTKGVVESWAHDVEWYNARSEALQRRWDEVAARIRQSEEQEGGGDSWWGLGQMVNSRDLIAKNMIESEATGLWQELQDRADAKAELLVKGPEDEAGIRYLVDSGVVGWGLWNASNDDAARPLFGAVLSHQYGPFGLESTFESRPQAVALGREYASFLLGDESDLSQQDIDRLHTYLATFEERALVHESNGTRFQGYELDGVATFLAGLDSGLGSKSGPLSDEQGIVSIATVLDERVAEADASAPWVRGDTSDSLGSSERDEILTMLGSSILILSNEDYAPTAVSENNAYDRLPASVRRFVEGEGATELGIVDTWFSDAAAMAPLLEGVDSEISGGVEFSANLSTTIGHRLNEVDTNPVEVKSGPPPGFMDSWTDSQVPFHEKLGDVYGYLANGPDDWSWDESLSTLIDVSSRNDDANYEILADRHEHPRYNENGNALKGLYSHNWSDDGAAVSGLTNWISDVDGTEPSSSADSARERGREAVLGLVEMLGGDTDRYDAVRGTGVTVQQADQEDVPNVSAGLVNPLVAQSLADASLLHLDALSDPADEEMERATIRYFELLMADETAAADLYVGAGIAEMVAVEGIAQGELEPGPAGESAAMLRAMMDTALRLEALDRTNDVEEAAEAASAAQERLGERTLGAVQGAAYAATGLVGKKYAVAASFFSAALGMQEFQFLRKDHFIPEVERVYQDVQSIPDGSGGQLNTEDGRTFDNTDTGHAVRYAVLSALVENGEISPDLVREEIPELATIDGESGDVEMQDFSEIGMDALTSTDGGEESLGNKVIRLLRGADAPEINQPIGDGASADIPTSTHEMVDMYLQEYFRTYMTIGETEMSMERAEELRTR